MLEDNQDGHRKVLVHFAGYRGQLRARVTFLAQPNRKEEIGFNAMIIDLNGGIKKGILLLHLVVGDLKQHVYRQPLSGQGAGRVQLEAKVILESLGGIGWKLQGTITLIVKSREKRKRIGEKV
jgi:hypothetical protein